MGNTRWGGLCLGAMLLICAAGCTNFRKTGGGSSDGGRADIVGDRVGTSDGSRDLSGGGSGGAGGAGGGGAFPGTGGGAGQASTSGGAPGSGGVGAGGAGAGGATAAGGGGAGGASATGGGGATVVCTASQHKCGDSCAANTSPDFCTTSCIKCVAPAGATATCDGTACGFNCGAMKKCTATSTCVPPTGCCGNADCPAMPGGQAGTCDSTTHQCNYSCPLNTQSCTSGGVVTCIPAGGCCQNSDCVGSCKVCSAIHACVAAANMDDPTGRCAGTCNATGVCKSKQGQLCSAVAAGCVEGTVCAPDGICCNTACTAACQACDIVGSTGTCTNVNSGLPHSNHVACGTDPACLGTCGAGQCTYTTKTCGAGPTCSGSTAVGQSTCAAGACVAPAPHSCVDYACAGTTCGMSCSGAATGCSATAYCTGVSCTPKKGPGQLCTAATQCTSNLCGSRCCNPGAPCTCTQPSAGNLVTNPGFDQNLSGWTITNAAGSSTAWLGSEDASGCPFSGSLSINAPADIGAESQFSQCVALTSTSVYKIGIQWKVLPSGPGNAGIICSASLTSSPTCAVGTGGPATTLIMSDLYPVGWSGYDPANFGIVGMLDNANGFSHLFITCSGRNGIAIDMVYVTASPGAY